MEFEHQTPDSENKDVVSSSNKLMSATCKRQELALRYDTSDI